MKSSHMLICVVLLLAGIGLVVGGAGSYVFLPLIFCGLMMGGMMWMMMRSGGHDRSDH